MFCKILFYLCGANYNCYEAFSFRDTESGTLIEAGGAVLYLHYGTL